MKLKEHIKLLSKYQIRLIMVCIIAFFATGFSLYPKVSCLNAPSHFEYIRNLAEAGHADEQFTLASAYEVGDRGQKKDFSKAVKWYQKSADLGYAYAQHTLGLLYAPDIESFGPRPQWPGRREAFLKEAALGKDYTEAAKWFRKAAEQDVEVSQYYLSILLRYGPGIQQDYPEAYFWLSLAARREGETGGKYQTNLDETVKYLSPEQVEAVKKRVDSWKPVKNDRQEKYTLNVAGIMCGRRDEGCKAVDTCGDIVGIDCGSATDGTYFFANKKTNEIIGRCSFWQSYQEQGPCKPPKEWTCGQRPKHYHG